ncbi:MAG TPA: acyl-CoA dehydrogenase family protein [Solirubrobacteraceae bacterium]|jgi:cyclohexanecarboxyl-CoA dehydrogenase|nr:acyl-CoA dehydrogenase family protein [Solirubrobacteraceae bacterium]
MDFSTTPEQDALVQTAREFAERELAPHYRARELERALHRPTLRRMGELSFFGISLPERHGGLGLDCVTDGLVLEALSGADMNINYVTVTVSYMGKLLVEFGAPEVAGPWVAGMVAGEKIPALSLTEPGGGSDAAHLSFRARRDGEDWILTGEKTSISMAAQADFTVLFARTGTAEQGARGISAFVVPLDLPGITRTEFDDHGSKSVGRGSLFFEDVRLPGSHLLGAEGGGFIGVMQGFDYSRALLSLQTLAVARRSLEETWASAAERTSFGRPLTAHQGVSFPLAEAETQLTACRWLCLRTLWLKDQGLPHTAEAAMCKWWGPKLAYEVVQTCLLTSGHGGYSTELPHEQRMRDILGLQIGDGTSQIMKLVIARQKAGRTAAP